MFDHDHRPAVLRRFELQAKLLLDCGENGGTIRIDCWKAFAIKRALQEPLWRPFQFPIEVAIETRAVNDRPSSLRPENRKVAEWQSTTCHLAGEHRVGHVAAR